MTNIIEINNLGLSYNDKLVFNNISFSANKKDFITIMGSNGSGKSLLANTLMGILPYEGSIKINGEELSSLTKDDISNNFSMIMDDNDNLYVEKTVISELMNICIDSRLLKMVIKELNIHELLERDPRTLSVGEKQLINIACVILEQKKIIILDNAFCMLDVYNKKRVFNLLKKINAKGTIIINITQDSEELLFSKRVIIVDKGTIIVDDDINKAFLKEKEFLSAHVNLPFIVELCTKLKYYNILSEIELDEMKLVNAIWK